MSDMSEAEENVSVPTDNDLPQEKPQPAHLERNETSTKTSSTSKTRSGRRAITADIEVAVHATKAVIALHNYLMTGRCFSDNPYCPPDYVDLELNGSFKLGGWREDNENTGMLDITNLSSNNYFLEVKTVRDNFRDYFNSNAGSVPWQNEMVTCTSYSFDRKLWNRI
ncbi:Hypothetical predicted protein [Paramuricea clavata]|uniref:Uncharacterized protein n=1 Tax=Paramuricea clavata TaxID=317549 RepID=A0A7D9E978_PARCT|nr:Hypothetical predicted protein [Paramuricea clavata]